MRKDIHPDNYRLVVFKDMTNEYSFICPSCATSSETISWEDGNEYPLVKLDISHKSHPFFTGIVQFVDTAGRIDKFKNRYGRHMKWFHSPYLEPLDFSRGFFFGIHWPNLLSPLSLSLNRETFSTSFFNLPPVLLFSAQRVGLAHWKRIWSTRNSRLFQSEKQFRKVLKALRITSIIWSSKHLFKKRQSVS